MADLVLFEARHAAGNDKFLQAWLALPSVFPSWMLIHTVRILKYPHPYYTGRPDFNETARPDRVFVGWDCPVLFPE